MEIFIFMISDFFSRYVKISTFTQKLSVLNVFQLKLSKLMILLARSTFQIYMADSLNFLHLHHFLKIRLSLEDFVQYISPIGGVS